LLRDDQQCSHPLPPKAHGAQHNGPPRRQLWRL
jgi:hypothetical protein